MSAPEQTRSPAKREAVERIDAMTDEEVGRVFPILMRVRNAPVALSLGDELAIAAASDGLRDIRIRLQEAVEKIGALADNREGGAA